MDGKQLAETDLGARQALSQGRPVRLIDSSNGSPLAGRRVLVDGVLGITAADGVIWLRSGSQYITPDASTDGDWFDQVAIETLDHNALPGDIEDVALMCYGWLELVPSRDQGTRQGAEIELAVVPEPEDSSRKIASWAADRDAAAIAAPEGFLPGLLKARLGDRLRVPSRVSYLVVAAGSEPVVVHPGHPALVGSSATREDGTIEYHTAGNPSIGVRISAPVAPLPAQTISVEVACLPNGDLRIFPDLLTKSTSVSIQVFRMSSGNESVVPHWRRIKRWHGQVDPGGLPIVFKHMLYGVYRISMIGSLDGDVYVALWQLDHSKQGSDLRQSASLGRNSLQVRRAGGADGPAYLLLSDLWLPSVDGIPDSPFYVEGVANVSMCFSIYGLPGMTGRLGFGVDPANSTLDTLAFRDWDLTRSNVIDL